MLPCTPGLGPPAQARPDEVALEYAQFSLWMNYDAMSACLAQQAGNGTEPYWSGGWDEPLQLIRDQATALAG